MSTRAAWDDNGSGGEVEKGLLGSAAFVQPISRYTSGLPWLRSGILLVNSVVPSGAVQRYNVLVDSPMDKTAHGRNRHHVYALETTGLLIVAATLLTITLARFWYAIHWNLR